MKKFPVAMMILLVNVAFAQSPHPVNWTYHVEQKSGDGATLIFQADIESGWHIYSQFTPDGGPLPTVFTMTNNECFEADGKITEPQAHKEFDSVFGVDVLTLEGKPTFTQKIKLRKSDCTIKGRVDGQVCKDVCLMFGDEFTFNIGKVKDDGAVKN